MEKQVPITRDLSLFDSKEVGRLLQRLGYGKYSQAFVVAGINGADLIFVESNADLKEVGVDMPGFVFKGLQLKLQEVGGGRMFHLKKASLH